MADKKISFSLDLSTDQAKRAIEDFQKQLGMTSQSLSSGMSDINRFSTALSDSFTKALNDAKILQDRIREDMKRGVLSDMAGGKMSGAVADQMTKAISQEMERTQAVVKQAGAHYERVKKQNEEILASFKETGKATEGQIAAGAAGSKQEKAYLDRLRQAEQKLAMLEAAQQAVAGGDSAKALEILSGSRAPTEAPKIGAPPTTVPTTAGGGGAGMPLQLGLLMNLLGSGGSLLPMVSGRGAMQAMGALGGMPGLVAATALSTIQDLERVAFNADANNAIAARQFASGGATQITADLMTREFIKERRLGAFGPAAKGNFGVFGGINFLYNLITQGGDAEAAYAVMAEDALQKSMPLAENQRRAYEIAINRGENFYGVERMYGAAASNVFLTGLNAFGISDARARPGMGLAAEFGLPLQATERMRNFINLQNKFNLSDIGYREVARAMMFNPNAGDVQAGMFQYAGIGGARGDIARQILSEQAAQESSRYGYQFAQQAQMPFYSAMQTAGGALPEMMEKSRSEVARIAGQVAGTRIREMDDPASLANAVGRSALIELGITDPMVQLQLVRMGLHNESTMSVIARMTGKGIGKIRATISGKQDALQKARENMFNEGAQRQTFTKALESESGVSGITFMGSLYDPKDPNKAAAFSQYTTASLFKAPFLGTTGEAKISDIAALAAGATGRDETTKDIKDASNARIYSQLLTMTDILSTGTLKVRIEGAESAAVAGMSATETKRIESESKQFLSTPEGVKMFQESIKRLQDPGYAAEDVKNKFRSNFNNIRTKFEQGNK